MNGYELESLLSRDDFRLAHRQLSDEERSRFASALMKANDAKRRFLVALDEDVPLGLGAAEEAAGVSIRMLMALGVMRSVLSQTWGRRRTPILEATTRATQKVEQMAVRLAIGRLAVDEPKLKVDLDRPGAMHQLLIRLVMDENAFAAASVVSDCSRSLEVAVEALCQSPWALAAQVRGLFSTATSGLGTTSEVDAALWVLTLRQACLPVSTDEPTVAYQ